MTAKTIADLQILWKNVNPKRADGGWWALSGFTVQMLVTLELFFRKTLLTSERIERVSIESLSDALIQQASITHLLQVKRTLNVTTLASAIREAYEIIALADPLLDSSLEFQIACEFRDPSLTIARVSPSQIFPKSEKFDIKILSRTLARFDASAPLVEIANPTLALQRTFWLAGVEDPAALMTYCLGMLFKAFDGHQRDKVDEAIFSIIQRVKEVARADRRPANVGRLLTAADLRISKPIKSLAKMLIGRRPRVGDLVQGRFRERRALLEELQIAVHAWLAGLSATMAEDDGVVHIFWIEGLAGDGKSVLLLQLLSGLVTTGKLPFVTELVDREEIANWLDVGIKWDAATVNNPGPPSIAAIDDLHEKIEKADLEALIARAFHRGSPKIAIITCGPSVDRNSFVGPGTRLVIKPFKVPELSREERAEFASWYEHLSGRQLQLESKAGKWLLVEWLLEISGGNLENEFANNLRGSLTRLKIFEVAKTVAAVNTLSVGAPDNLLTSAAAKAGFKTVSSEGVQHFELRTEQDRTGIFLTHPVLVWPLFRAWTQQDGVNLGLTWGHHIGVALLHFLNANQAKPARMVLGQLLDRNTLRDRFGGAKAIERLRISRAILESAFEIVAQGSSLVEQAPLIRLWLTAQRIERLTVPSATNLRKTAAEILDRTDISAVFQSEIATALIIFDVTKTDDEAVVRAKSYLLSVECSATVIAFFETLIRKNTSHGQLPFLALWLKSRIADLGAAKVFAAAVEHQNEIGADVLGLAFAFVRRNAAAPGASVVMSALAINAQHHREFRQSLFVWLGATREVLTVSRILSHLLQSSKGQATYRHRTLVWLENNLNVASAHEVLKLLMLENPYENRLLRIVDEWLAKHTNSMPAAQVLAALMRVRSTRDRWLTAAERHVAMTTGAIQRDVLCALVNFTPSKENIVAALSLVHVDPNGAGLRFLFGQVARGLRRLSPSKIVELREICPPDYLEHLDRAMAWSRPTSSTKPRKKPQKSQRR